MRFFSSGATKTPQNAFFTLSEIFETFKKIVTEIRHGGRAGEKW